MIHWVMNWKNQIFETLFFIFSPFLPQQTGSQIRWASDINITIQDLCFERNKLNDS